VAIEEPGIGINSLGLHQQVRLGQFQSGADDPLMFGLHGPFQPGVCQLQHPLAFAWIGLPRGVLQQPGGFTGNILRQATHEANREGPLGGGVRAPELAGPHDSATPEHIAQPVVIRLGNPRRVGNVCTRAYRLKCGRWVGHRWGCVRSSGGLLGVAIPLLRQGPCRCGVVALVFQQRIGAKGVIGAIGLKWGRVPFPSLPGRCQY
jgi:hypothetical protein